MRYVHTAHNEGAAAELDSGDRLLIRRGQTRFPVRPLTSERFLIGSGTNCHLQLAGGLPILHSLLIREDGRWVLEAIAPEPTLIVNDTTCRRQVLQNGDVIRVGEFEFALSSDNGGREAERNGNASDRQHDLASVAQEEAGRLSAHDLVNCLEREFRLIDRLGHTRRAGGTALLRAIQRQGNAYRPRAA